jgi:hypothetical protein
MDLPSSLPDRATLIDTLVDALERDATWVETYEVTGELKVPKSPNEEKLGETLRQVKKVRSILMSIAIIPSYVFSSWKDISTDIRHSESGVISGYQLMYHA